MKTANALARRPKNYRKLLLAKKVELSASLRSKLDTLAASGTALEDLPPVFTDQFIALRINSLGYLQLKLIEAALARIDSKEYGVCADCGKAIPSVRLEAVPWAIRCIGCQELFAFDGDASFAHDSAHLDEESA